jgi:hypothetical protein
VPYAFPYGNAPYVTYAADRRVSRSRRDVPPQMPCKVVTSKLAANSRHSRCTRHRPQTARTSSIGSPRRGIQGKCAYAGSRHKASARHGCARSNAIK